MKITRTDALAHHVPLGAARDEVHLLRVHDVLQLLSHFAHLAHGFHVDEVLATPRGRVPEWAVIRGN